MSRSGLTKHQKAVLEIFESSGKPHGVQDILRLVGPDKPGQATVYRAIARLQEMELILPVDIHGATPMWESASSGHHHHFFCTGCHEVYSLTGCPHGLPELVPQGFQMRHHSIVLYGSCPECGENPPKDSDGS